MSLFLTQKFLKKYINRPESYFSIKKHEIFGGVLSFDNMRGIFFCTLRRSKDVIFHEKNIHEILLDLFRKQFV